MLRMKTQFMPENVFLPRIKSNGSSLIQLSYCVFVFMINPIFCNLHVIHFHSSSYFPFLNFDCLIHDNCSFVCFLGSFTSSEVIFIIAFENVVYYLCARYILVSFCSFDIYIHVHIASTSWFYVRIEPRCEKTGIRGFRPGPTQTGL